MIELRPLKGTHQRIKFAPCPEGADAQKGTVIGEIDCDQCPGTAMAYVYVGEGGHVYAFHNNKHPRAINDEIDQVCGCTLLKTNRPQGKNIIRHWTAQRYSKKDTTHAQPKKTDPKISTEKLDRGGAAKPAAKRAAAPRSPGTGTPAATPPDDSKPAPARTGAAWWE